MEGKFTKRMGRVDFQEKRENAMRPCRFLGYDHDRLGVYFLGREVPSLAEGEFRRAVWLNPFEPEFKMHLAMCLFQQKQYVEAINLTQEVLQSHPERNDAIQLIALANSRLSPSASSSTAQSRGPHPLNNAAVSNPVNL